MGSLMTKRRYVDVFELEFDEYGGGVKVLNTRSEEVIFDGDIKDLLCKLRELVFTIENFDFNQE